MNGAWTRDFWISGTTLYPLSHTALQLGVKIDEQKQSNREVVAFCELILGSFKFLVGNDAQFNSGILVKINTGF